MSQAFLDNVYEIFQLVIRKEHHSCHGASTEAQDRQRYNTNIQVTIKSGS